MFADTDNECCARVGTELDPSQDEKLMDDNMMLHPCLHPWTVSTYFRISLWMMLVFRRVSFCSCLLLLVCLFVVKCGRREATGMGQSMVKMEMRKMCADTAERCRHV